MTRVPILKGAVCVRDEQVVSLIHTRDKAECWSRLLGTAISSEGTEGREGWANLSVVKRFAFVLIVLIK